MRPAKTDQILQVGALYPEQLNIYADRGNLIFLRRRCEWRGIEFRLLDFGPGEPFDPRSVDLVYVGGGQDSDQASIAEDMLETKRAGLVEALGDGAALLAVCGGYQLLGHRCELEDRIVDGLGICDLETRREGGPRLIGNVAIEADGLDDAPLILAGFENHAGRTYLGPGAKPLGRVLDGHGNNGRDQTEGVRDGRLIGTYLHGPLLPKNAVLADWLISQALGRSSGDPVALEPLPDALESAAHESALRAAGRS